MDAQLTAEALQGPSGPAERRATPATGTGSSRRITTLQGNRLRVPPAPAFVYHPYARQAGPSISRPGFLPDYRSRQLGGLRPLEIAGGDSAKTLRTDLSASGVRPGSTHPTAPRQGRTYPPAGNQLHLYPYRHPRRERHALLPSSGSRPPHQGAPPLPEMTATAFPVRSGVSPGRPRWG